MTWIVDALMTIAALGAAAYCVVLSRRLNRFSRLEGGMGSAVAVLSAQVDALTQALERAQSQSEVSARELEALMRRTEAGAQRLELMLASVHDIDPPREARAGRAVRRRERLHQAGVS